MLRWGKKPQFGISQQQVNKMGVQCQMETVLTLIKLQMVGVQNKCPFSCLFAKVVRYNYTSFNVLWIKSYYLLIPIYQILVKILCFKDHLL